MTKGIFKVAGWFLLFGLASCSGGGGGQPANPAPSAQAQPQPQPMADQDQDGIEDATDNCPADANPDQADNDNDGVGDVCALPAGGGGQPIAGGQQPGAGEVQCDDRLDNDGDGFPDCADPDCNAEIQCGGRLEGNCRDLIDDDGDGFVDCNDAECLARAICRDGPDIDTDADGLLNKDDNCPEIANPGLPQADRDQDGVGDACDNCPDHHNMGQQDQNRDGIGDLCAFFLLDSDRDGVPDFQDNCDQNANPDQQNRDGDDEGDLCDLCPNLAFAGAADLDQDRIGDKCDEDDEGDGVPDARDNCPVNANGGQGDQDGDGLGDVCDPNPIPRAGNIVSYFDELLTPAQRQGRSDRYRAIFNNDRLLSLIYLDRDHGTFHQWDEALKRRFLEMIIFYEENQGNALPPFQGNCSERGGENSCYRTDEVPPDPPQTTFVPDYTHYLSLTQAAWHLYVEANRLTPWSILNFSRESLAILFESTHLVESLPSQPGLTAQFYLTNWNIVENYQIVRGQLRERGDIQESLQGATALETILKATQFVGERVKHFRGSDRNTMGPRHAYWPYRARDGQGQPLYDAQGIRVPLDRHPTVKEVLIYRDPHHDTQLNPEAPYGPQYHIVNGCWGTSALLKSLLASINLPVQLEGDYISFAGHSGVRFREVEGRDYYIQHSDNLYEFPWAFPLLTTRAELSGIEEWGVEGFSPFRNFINGYSIFHSSPLPDSDEEIARALSLPEDRQALFTQQLGEGFVGFFPFDRRILALRATSKPPSVQNLYMRCTEPGVRRLNYPLPYLTDQEEANYFNQLDQVILQRRQRVGRNASCLDLYFNELNGLYFKKTGAFLRGDEDQDGIENFKDCNVHRADPPGSPSCEGTPRDFRRSVEMIVVGQ